MMTSNINQFLKSVNKDIKTIQDKQQKRAKEIILYAHDEIVNTSPWDTTLFRHSNFLTMGEAPNDTIKPPKTREEREGKAEQNTAIQRQQQASLSLRPLKDGDTFTIYNNLKYAERLENGWSSQQPYGVYGVVEEKVKKLL